MQRRFWVMATLAAVAGLAGCSDDDPVTPPPPPADTVEVFPVESPPQEARALWISRYDWSGEQQLRDLIANAARANFNIIYMQVRGRADAYYRSNLEPWGHRPPAFVLGQDPGWDPLAVAIEAAHAEGLELHAWINALIGWCTTDPIPETTPRHILLAHPEWKMVDQSGQTHDPVENCTFVTPGDPAARAHIAAVAADITRNYDVEGIHLDYIRYPSTAFSWDSLSRRGWAEAEVKEPGLKYDEWRRRLVTMLVREVHDSITAVKPSARLSAAVWGVYKPRPGWTGVAGGYDTRFQDSWKWVEDGIIDAIVPMIYWPITRYYGGHLDFGWLADDFADNVTNRHLYIGMGVYAPNVDANFCKGCDVVRQIYRARAAGGNGVSVYSGQLMRGANAWDRLLQGPFKTRVPVPDMPWKPK